MATAGKPQRDVRLDFFRGLALWLIFLDHIPGNIVNWFTLRNYGFSDAAELFIFISGYTAAFVYGRTMRERGFVVAGARILRRAWQIYVAHVVPVRHLRGGDRLRLARLREPAVRRGNEHPRVPAAAARDPVPGDAAQVQAGQHGHPAGLHRAVDRISAAAVAAPARADARAGGLDRDLRALPSVRLEPAVLSERPLDHQSVLLAAAVRIRRLVRGVRRRTTVLRRALARRGDGFGGLRRVRLRSSS